MIVSYSMASKCSWLLTIQWNCRAIAPQTNDVPHGTARTPQLCSLSSPSAYVPTYNDQRGVKLFSLFAPHGDCRETSFAQIAITKCSRPNPNGWNSAQTVFFHCILQNSLLEMNCIFFHHDSVRKPLQVPKDGHFWVIFRKSKTFLHEVTSRENWISIDCHDSAQWHTGTRMS